MLRGAFRAREITAGKYSVGTVSVVGGSGRYLHAPVIAGLGARAAGAGLVQLVCPAASRFAAGVHLPEATFTRLSATCVPPKADVYVVGMGLGVSAFTEVVVSRLLSGVCGRFVFDADALTMLARLRSDGRYLGPAEGQEIVITPHEGEAARLLGCSREAVEGDRISSAKALVGGYGATVALKGAGTVVVSSDLGRIYVNETGNPFMALGGMGDLLAGVIGARWAYLKDDPFLATAGGVWMHGIASDRVVAERRDPSIVNTAAEIGSLRVMKDA